jgi:hypothetical protein
VVKTITRRVQAASAVVSVLTSSENSLNHVGPPSPAQRPTGKMKSNPRSSTSWAHARLYCQVGSDPESRSVGK